MGNYSDIVNPVIPASAQAGSTVTLSWGVRNKWTGSLLVISVIILNGVRFWWTVGPEFWIPAGATQSFSGYFTMPSADLPVDLRSYFKGDDGLYYLDDQITDEIKVGAVTGWIKLADTAVTIYASGAPEVGGWEELDRKQVEMVVGVVGGWEELDGLSLGVGVLNGVPPPPPPPPPPPSEFPWVPVLIGVGVASGVGGMAYLEQQKKKKKEAILTK